MILVLCIYEQNAERVYTHKFVFTMGRTILASHPGALPTYCHILWSLDLGRPDLSSTFS
jgi:hypothetical protein